MLPGNDDPPAHRARRPAGPMHAAVGHYHTTVPTRDYVASATPWTDPYANYDSDASAHSVHSVHSQRGYAPAYSSIDNQGYQSDASIHSHHSHVAAGPSTGAYHDGPVGYDSDASAHSQRSYALQPPSVDYYSDASVHSHHSYTNAPAPFHNPAHAYDMDAAAAHLQRLDPFTQHNARLGMGSSLRSDVSGYESAASARSGYSDYADAAYASDGGESARSRADSDAEGHAYHSAKSDTEYASAKSDAEGFTTQAGAIDDPPMPDRYRSVYSKARHNKYKDVEAMFLDGAPVDGRDQYGNTVLHVACQNGHKRLAKSCLRAGSNVNSQNLKGQTPLHFCFAFGYPDLGEYLIDRVGANPDIKNYYGLNAYEGLGLKAAAAPK